MSSSERNFIWFTYSSRSSSDIDGDAPQKADIPYERLSLSRERKKKYSVNKLWTVTKVIELGLSTGCQQLLMSSLIRWNEGDA